VRVSRCEHIREFGELCTPALVETNRRVRQARRTWQTKGYEVDIRGLETRGGKVWLSVVDMLRTLVARRPPRRIQKTAGVRRETAGVCLRETAVALRPPGLSGRGPAKPVNEATTDFGVDPAAKTALPSACACLMHRDAIELGLSRGRNARAIRQDRVDMGGH